MNETKNSKSLLSEYAVGRDNNFNLMRFAAASAVVMNHSHAVVGLRETVLPTSLGMDTGDLAVDLFFASSGFLVTGSLLKRNLADFFRARLARIYPAYILALVFCVLVVGLMSTSLTAKDYFCDPETGWFLIKNLLLLFGTAFSLPAVFENLPIKGVVNGSLWTLPWEGRMYGALGGIALVANLPLLRFKRIDVSKKLIIAVGIVMVSLQLWNLQNAILPSRGMRVTAMFFSGALLSVLKERIPFTIFHALVCALTLCLSATSHAHFQWVYTLTMPYIVLAIAYLPGGAIRNFNKCGDYSYGIYIFSFPIQQILVETLGISSPVNMFACSFVGAILLAVPSWHLVEKPSLEWAAKLNRQAEPNEPSSTANSKELRSQAEPK